MNDPQSPDWEEIECNRRLIGEVAEEQDLYISQVEGVLQHYSRYIARTIRSGSMEGVTIPYLGKIQVKHRAQQYKRLMFSLPPEWRKLLNDMPSKEKRKLFKL